MRKRMISFLLAITLVCQLLFTALPLTANAVTVSSYPPYASIQYDYSESVECGTIRYIRQSVNGTYFYSAYWPASPFGNYSGPGNECGTACISMALSYVGVNKTPKDILEKYNGSTVFDGGWGATYMTTSIATGMSNYLNGNGKYSPVIIHLNYGQSIETSDPGHFVLIVGKVSDNVWQIMDPADSSLTNYQIDGSSITYKGVANTIDSVRQYYNADAVIVKDYAANECTSYPCAVNIEVTEACSPYTQPCNPTTASELGYVSEKLTSKALSTGDILTASGLYENSEGNYWYKVTLSDGTIAYLYSTHTQMDSLVYPWVDGGSFPTSITGTTNLQGTVTAGGAQIDAVQAFVYPQGSYTAALTSDRVTVNAATYPLKSSTVDKTLVFGDLANYGAGNYVLEIVADFTTYYADNNQLSTSGLCDKPAASYSFYYGSASVSNVTITFNANGGSCSTGSKSVVSGGAIGTLPTASKSGYDFIGWTGTQDSAGVLITSDTTFSENTTLYAHYANRLYTGSKITFDANGGTLPAAVSSYELNGFNIPRETDHLVVYNCGGETVGTNYYGTEAAVDSTGMVTKMRLYENNTQISVPDGGFVLSGHGAGSDYVGSISVGDYVAYDEDSMMVYVYDSEEAYLTHHKYVTSGAACGTLPTATRSEYSFDGWYTAASGGTKVTSSTTFSSNTTLYAHWTSDSYTVTYDANGGSGAPDSQSVTPGETMTLSDVVPTRFGCTFLGWATYSSASDPAYFPGDSFTADGSVTLYAVWQDASTLISNDASDEDHFVYFADIPFAGASVFYTFTPSSSGDVVFESSGDLDTQIYLYDADGNQLAWDDDDGVDLNFFLAHSVTAGEQYYVKLKYFSSGTGTIAFTFFNGYGICYNANGGWNEPASQIKIPGEPLTLSAGVPLCSGRTFLGWSTSSDASAPTYWPGESYTADASATLYAVWQDAETITVGDTASSYSASIPFAYGTVSYTFIPTFSGDIHFQSIGDEDTVITLYDADWNQIGFSDDSESDLNFHLTCTVTASEQYYVEVQFAQEGTGTIDFVVSRAIYVHYDANGGSSAPASQSYAPGIAQLLSAVVPERFGYTFLGWSTSSSASAAAYLPGADFTTQSSTTLYAVWQSAEVIPSGVSNTDYSVQIPFSYISKYYVFTPSFTGNVHLESSSSQDTLLCVYDAAGNEIAYSDDDGDEFNFALTYAATAGTTYYVQVRYYNAQTGTLNFNVSRAYDVIYNANGGSGAPDPQEKLYGTALTLHTTQPTRDGYTFRGWATSSSAASAAYQPGDSYVSNASVTLYAVWGAETEAIAVGYSGDLTWVLTDDGTLTFSGSGKMKSYGYKSEMPWYEYADQITSVVLDDGVTSIGSYAFYGMPNLVSVFMPEGVTSIGDYAFKNCTALESVVLPATLTQLGESSFYACTSLSSIEIPAKLYTVKPYTFKNCTALTEVIFNEGNLQKISDGAFYNTALTEVTFPDCLSIIDAYSFKNCANLASITLGSGITQIREAVFYGTAIPTIAIPEGVTSIGPYAFKNCVDLVSVSLPSTLTSIGEASFYACTALESLDLPDAVTKIGNYAFRKCAALADISFGSSLQNIGESAFYGCEGLIYLSIPAKVTTIQGYAFKGCTSLEIVDLPDSLVTLGDSAFHTCTGLTEITIPANVETIGEYCFSGSTGIDYITFLGDAPAIGSGAFNKITATAYYPGDNATWTASVLQNYGGTITWKAQ